MDILETIVAVKKTEVEQLYKTFVPNTDLLNKKSVSLAAHLIKPNSTGIIAEFKRKSPSKGWFKTQNTAVMPIVSAYEKLGAAGVSILTDEQFFGGNDTDVIEAKQQLTIPILRKDFIIDTLQITAAKQMGADVILLIAAILTPKQVVALATHAKTLGLEVLLELHGADEIDRVCVEVDMIGINNRNLKTFEVNIEQSIKLAEMLPKDKLKIAESGIDSPETVKYFKKYGYSGFLIGEQFMKFDNTANEFEKFVSGLK
jgi:indole-3-glycerol phosphate synthase